MANAYCVVLEKVGNTCTIAWRDPHPLQPNEPVAMRTRIAASIMQMLESRAGVDGPPHMTMYVLYAESIMVSKWDQGGGVELDAAESATLADTFRALYRAAVADFTDNPGAKIDVWHVVDLPLGKFDIFGYSKLKLAAMLALFVVPADEVKAP